MKQFNTSSTPENSFHKAIIVVFVFCCLAFASSVNAQSVSPSTGTKEISSSSGDIDPATLRPTSASVKAPLTKLSDQSKATTKNSSDVNSTDQSTSSQNLSTQNQQNSSPAQTPAASRLAARAKMQSKLSTDQNQVVPASKNP